MASNFKLGLRAYSFSLRKWHTKRPDKVYDLNKVFLLSRKDGEPIMKENALALFEDFITANMTMSDKEIVNQLFSCGYDSIDKGETSTYSYLIFSVYAGYYGYASDLINRNSMKATHHKTKDEADVKKFYVLIVIPKDQEDYSAKRGLMFFQEIGNYGIKSVTSDAIQAYFYENFEITFRTQNLAPDFYFKKLFDTGVLQRLRLARNYSSADTADKLYGAGYGYEERSFVPLKVTKELKRKLKHVSESNFHYFTFEGVDYSDVKMEMKIGDRIRTINLHGIDKLSVEEALPEEILLSDGTIDYAALKANLLLVTEEYLQHLPINYD